MLKRSFASNANANFKGLLNFNIYKLLDKKFFDIHKRLFIKISYKGPATKVLETFVFLEVK